MRHKYFDDSVSSPDLHRRSLRGGVIAVIGQGGNVALSVISTVVLARILLPEDFGLVAMVTAMTGFATILVDLGTRDAVSQRGKVNEGEVSALFWVTSAVGLAFAALIILCAPLMARFYAEPRMTHIAVLMSVTFLLPGMYFQQYALMRRALMFKTLAMIDFSSNLLATIAAIVLAQQGFGYWALVWKPVLLVVFTGLGVWLSCGWWPKRPTFTTGVKELLGFGLNVTGYSVTDYVARAIDRVALGYTTGPRELGYYQNAFTVYDNAINLTAGTLHNIATVTLSKLRSDLPALRSAWSTALSSLTYFVAPSFAILGVIGQDLVVIMLGHKWATAGAILSVLALRGPAHVVERSHGWLHIAAGRPERWRRWGMLTCVLTVVALFCGLPFGAFGVATSYTILMYLMFIPAIAYAGKPLGIGPADVIRTVGPPVGTALASAAVGYILRFTVLANTAPLVRLLILGALCSAIYLLAMTFCFRVTKPLALAASLVHNRKATAG